MCKGITTLEQLDPAARLALKIATAMTEVGLNLARLKLNDTDIGLVTSATMKSIGNEVRRSACT